MFLLKKVFQLRDKANPDLEKPFLDHLEDLRVMITRIVLTLVVSMLGCFAFQDDLMAILRKPVNEVWLTHEQGLLADDIDAKTWEAAKRIERAAAGLDDTLAPHFLDRFDSPTRELVATIRLLRAVATLPESQRAEFLAAAGPDSPPAARVTTLLKNGASPEIDLRGNLQMMSTLRPTEGFMLSMKLAFFAGIIVSFPLLLLFILQFVLPGLHQHEKRVLWPALAIGFGLFLLGVSFAYFLVLPRALEFFHEWNLKLGVANDWRIGDYITFATQFTLLFGLSFELPVVVMVFVKLGLLSYETMSRTRAYAILAIVVIAAIITPTPDAFTLCLMALPMILLYEGCIWMAWFDARKQLRDEQNEERARMERLLMASDETEISEGSDRDDPWDPSACEEGWREGERTCPETEDETKTPPQA
ncbi:MAG: twin-arginine translocase subunit TatC [Verrucomicrobia bacterium]|nr:MAG: twin-arginine translocase subunit TatC [Verrucomicrobiota bacterium]TAE88184.1 MAG: twin-arginine translocase subunit TatC [Verrucomicrobiota bacterium]TAF26068.1 MAG: twin-arginine translocase subunit TatC [Verrucomicrobiota bacterium]TAF41006.1 MAG: twin-arginine translocase subunit TatC [Verrucomicrobiota bacterium]